MFNRNSMGNISVAEDLKFHKEMMEAFALKQIKEFNEKNNTNYVSWDQVSEEATLTEEFILKNSELINWKKISRFQKLSENFIDNNMDKLDITSLAKNNKCNLGLELMFKLQLQLLADIKDKLNENSYSKFDTGPR